MKNLLSLLTISALATSGLLAQGKLDPGSRARARALAMPTQIVKKNDGTFTVKERSRAKSIDRRLNAFITLAPGHDASELTAIEGVEYRVSRTGVVLASFPLATLGQLESLDAVGQIQIESPVNLKLDAVRTVTGVNKIHVGEGLPQAYTGKGVVCGIVDGGFDPNHVNFLDADGKQRIKQFTYFRGIQNSTQLAEERITGDEILKIDTENDESFHATHTTGIMAGGYRGKVKVSSGDYYRPEVVEVDNPYYGIACEADIATASAYQGQLSDMYIAYGIESILDYAWETGKPCSINLSLGSNVGSHDGKSAICQYLDEIIKDTQVNTVVSISAGNEGDMPIALTHRMSENQEQFGTFLAPTYPQIQSYQNPRAGLVYIYSDSAEPFEIQGVIMNSTRQKVAVRMTVDSDPNGVSKYYVSSQGYAQDESDIVDEGFARYITGYFGMNCMTDNQSGRYCVVLDFMMFDNVDGVNASGAYIPGFLITGKKGQTISVYGDGGLCTFAGYNMESLNYKNGEFDGTINDIATGHCPIIVGSFNSREHWTNLDGQSSWYGAGVIPQNEMSAFTSFGTLIDGRQLPDICAPGATVISSVNEYYLEATKTNDDAYIQGLYDDNNRRYSWQQCIGTSMAAPVVAGTVALWLEAYPELTCEEAKKIMKETAVVDNAVLTTGNPVQWGAGKLDAYAGLKKVLELKNAGVGNIAIDDADRLMVRPSGPASYEIYVPGADALQTAVYNLQGALVYSHAADGCEATVDLSTLADGIYVLSVNNKYSQKISLKK